MTPMTQRTCTKYDLTLWLSIAIAYHRLLVVGTLASPECLRWQTSRRVTARCLLSANRRFPHKMWLVGPSVSETIQGKKNHSSLWDEKKNDLAFDYGRQVHLNTQTLFFLQPISQQAMGSSPFQAQLSCQVKTTLRSGGTHLGNLSNLSV